MKLWLLALLSISLIASSAALANDGKTIYWLFFELPGAVNFQEKERRGYIMDIYLLLKSKMPEYTHQVVEVPFVRIIQQMKKKQSVCTLMILKNEEREKYMTFSSPYLVGLPAGVIVAKNNPKLKKYFNKSRLVELEPMLKDKTVQFGSIPERFYGRKISETLAKYRSTRMIEKKGSNSDHELRNMLKLGRIDVYFGYPFEVLNDEQLEFYFVKDNYDFLEPRISCNNSELGKTIVARTEEVRKKYKLNQQFDSIYERYYPKSFQDEFRKITK